MKTDAITSTNFGLGIKINAKEKQNKAVKLLYNSVLEMVREHHLPAEFRPYEITISSVTQSALDKLKSLNVVYKEIV